MIFPRSVEVLTEAISIVADRQPELFTLKVGERAISAQIGWTLGNLVMHLNELDGWSVDLEYDREGMAGELKVRYDQESPQPRHQMSSGLKHSSVQGVPDIVLHHRGFQGPDDNLLVVEIKRTYRIFAATSVDRIKVNEFMDRHGYQHGCLVGLGPRIGVCAPEISWRKLADTQWVTTRILCSRGSN